MAIVCLVLALVGAILWMRGAFRHDVFDFEHEHLRLRQLRYARSKDAYDKFGELAKQQGWEIWAWDGFYSVGRFHLGRWRYEPVYSALPGTRILSVSRPHSGRVALIEDRTQRSGAGESKASEHSNLVLLGGERVVTSDPLRGRFAIPLIELGVSSVFFGELDEAYVYDLNTHSLDRVFSISRGSIENLAMVEGRFLILRLWSGKVCRLVVLSATEPYSHISQLDDVSAVVVTGGGDIVVERDGACFVFDAERGAAEYLSRGNVVCGAEHHEFLLRVLTAGNLSSGGWEVYRYNLSERREELIWTCPRSDGDSSPEAPRVKPYDHKYLMMSPEGRFLFVPFGGTWRKVILWREYEVYDLTTGEQRGAFLNPYHGKYFLRFLGWPWPACAEEPPSR